MTAIRLSLETELMNALQELKESSFPFMKYPEIIRIALGDYINRQKEEQYQKKFRDWDTSLPHMELTDEQQKDLTIALKEMENEEGDIMTADEFMKTITV